MVLHVQERPQFPDCMRNRLQQVPYFPSFARPEGTAVA